MSETQMLYSHYRGDSNGRRLYITNIVAFIPISVIIVIMQNWSRYSHQFHNYDLSATVRETDPKDLIT